MDRNLKPAPDLFGPAALSKANQDLGLSLNDDEWADLGLSLNDDEWAVIDEALDRMHRELTATKKSDAPAGENQ